MAELEKLGQKYKVALKIAKVCWLIKDARTKHCVYHLYSFQDPRVERIPCTHSGTYADDCLVQRVQQHKCYIVATCDRDLRRRIRKV